MLATPAPTEDGTDAARGALQAQYPQNAWFAAVQRSRTIFARSAAMRSSPIFWGKGQTLPSRPARNS
jgi:hypothetical protein